jgi:hypothetical protein
MRAKECEVRKRLRRASAKHEAFLKQFFIRYSNKLISKKARKGKYKNGKRIKRR